MTFPEPSKEKTALSIIYTYLERHLTSVQSGIFADGKFNLNGHPFVIKIMRS